MLCRSTTQRNTCSEGAVFNNRNPLVVPAGGGRSRPCTCRMTTATWGGCLVGSRERRVWGTARWPSEHYTTPGGLQTCVPVPVHACSVCVRACPGLACLGRRGAMPRPCRAACCCFATPQIATAVRSSQSEGAQQPLRACISGARLTVCTDAHRGKWGHPAPHSQAAAAAALPRSTGRSQSALGGDDTGRRAITCMLQLRQWRPPASQPASARARARGA